jgi:ketosteroid isomerase-like protein
VSAQATSAASVEVVLAFERAVCAAYERNDAQALDTLLADGYTLTDSWGVITTKSDDLRAARDRDVEYSTFHNEGMTVRLFGNAAIVLGRTVVKGKARDGSLVDVEVQFTDTLVLICGRWRLAAGHVSRLRSG